MTRIRFEDLPSTNTPINASNLNKLNNVVINPTEPTTGEEVWIQKGKNLLNPKVIFSDTRYYSVNEDLSVNVIAFDGSNLSGKGGVKLPAGTYTLSCFDRNNAFLQVYNLTLDEPILDRQQDVNVFTLTKESIVVIKVYREDLSVFPFTIHIMLEQGETSTSYEPYIDKKIYTKNDNGGYEEFYNIESGSNANGNYIKYADGTLIQRGKYTTTPIAPTSGYMQTVNLPINFIDNDYNVITQKMSGGSGGFSEVIESVYVVDSSKFDVTSWNNASGTADALTIGWVAIGRWK